MIRQSSLVFMWAVLTAPLVSAQEGKEKPSRPISGVVKAVDAKAGTILISVKAEKMSGEFTFAIGADAKISIEGKAIKLEDLKVGTSISAQLSADQKSVVAIGDAPQRGEKPGPKKPRGIASEIKGLDVKSGSISLPIGDGGQERTFKFAPNVIVAIDGKEAKLEDLKVGMKATFTFDESRQIVSVTVGGAIREGGDKPIRDGVTTTELKAIDAKVGTITLPPGDGGQERIMKLSPNVKIVIDGNEAKVEDLKAGMKAALKIGEGKIVVGITVGKTREK